MERPIGLMAAMEAEIRGLYDLLSESTIQEMGGRTYVAGKLFDRSVVAVFSRWGKVAAATTATQLIAAFDISEIIFTGVAGAIHPSLRVGDIVIGAQCFQHDMDARPLMPRFEIPLTGKKGYTSPLACQQRAAQAASTFSQKKWATSIPQDIQAQFALSVPQIITGDLASGDQFVAHAQQREALHTALPSVLAVEMEGAAVAQVCSDYQVPFSIIRIISDAADEAAEVDFPAFVEQVASHYTLGIVQEILLS